MKNIIIWGVPRSGKSTLAYRIRQEFGHSVICLGYTVISPEEKVKEMVRYETARDWSYKMSMEAKFTQCETFCNESKMVRKTAERLGLQFFDVSFDREKVFDEIIQYIRQNIS